MSTPPEKGGEIFTIGGLGSLSVYLFARRLVRFQVIRLSTHDVGKLYVYFPRGDSVGIASLRRYYKVKDLIPYRTPPDIRLHSRARADASRRMSTPPEKGEEIYTIGGLDA